MGYDASALSEAELLRQARLLLDTGLYRAGYRVLRLGDTGRFVAPEAIAASLRSQGFQLDLTFAAATAPEEARRRLEALGAQMATIVAVGDRDAARRLADALPAGTRIAVSDGKGLSWAADFANVVDLNNISAGDDFFEITRNRLDSCRDGDTDVSRSEANLRNTAIGKNGGAWCPGNLPLRFDACRNEAIFAQYCMLGCPLVLDGDIAGYSVEKLALLRRDALIDIARRGCGRVARYYDPWHVLLVKPLDSRRGYVMILNRCHGKQPTNFLPGDMGWTGRFSLRQLPENTLVGANLETFEVHVETSDHPETPCCRIYLAELLSE